MRCPSCIEPGTLACAGCKNVSYCSLACQQTDWSSHKLLCKTFKDFQVRPSPEMCRVIVFPTTRASKPMFQWLPAKDSDLLFRSHSPVTSIPDRVSIDTRSVIGDTQPKTLSCTINSILRAKLDKTIKLCFDDCLHMRVMVETDSIRSATNGKTTHCWFGPMVAYRHGIAGEEISKVYDMDMNSYSDLVACLIAHQNVSQEHQLRMGPKVQAVRAHRLGDNSSGVYKPVMIPRMHPIFDDGEVSQISQHIGMPLLLRKDVRKKYPGPINHDHSNSALTFMMLACDPKKPSFGWAPPSWQGGQVPNTLVVRQDREPLNPETLEALGDYCENFLQPDFELATELAQNPLQYRSVVSTINRKMSPGEWASFLSEWEPRSKENEAQFGEAVKMFNSGKWKGVGDFNWTS